jgi:hypothetical protein
MRTTPVSDPLERITLALRPKNPDAGASKQDPSAMETLPSGVDRAVLEELKAAARTYDYLRQFGEPIEFWEAVRLARSRRSAPDPADAKGKGVADSALADELQVIRRQLSPMVHDLRRFLERVPDLPPAGESLEVSLGFLLASSKEHQAVAKWLAESDKHLAKAASKLRSLSGIAAPYLEVLRPWSLDGKYAEKTQQAAAPPPGPPVVLDPDLLDNLRRTFATRAAFDATQLPSAFWEALMLNSAERIPSQARLLRIIQAKKDRQLAVFHEETRYLHARMLTFRARHSRWVEALQTWARGLPGVPRDETLFEMAVGLLVVEPDAQERARQWLAAPQAHAGEAAELLSSLAARAKAHSEELRKAAASPAAAERR